jgi:hypothetical protein
MVTLDAYFSSLFKTVITSFCVFGRRKQKAAKPQRLRIVFRQEGYVKKESCGYVYTYIHANLRAQLLPQRIRS